MNNLKNYLLIAHYHSKGTIRNDLIELIKEANKKFKEIVFISTKIKKTEIKKISKYSKIIVRRNYGYDFYSYKVGIQYLLKKNKNNLSKKLIFFMASSIFYAQPKKLISKIMNEKKINNKVISLTKSWEMSEHLQTDIFFFKMELFKNKKFFNWWNNIRKFTNRHIIIMRYELGFTDLLNKLKIKYTTLFKKNIYDYPSNIIKLTKKRIKNIFFKEIKIYKKNPTHFYWENIFKNYGIIKIDLIKNNPNNINLNNLKKYFSKREIKNLYKIALKN